MGAAAAVSNIPPTVQRNAQEADRIHREIYGDPAAEAKPEAEVVAEVAEPVAEAPPAPAPEPVAETPPAPEKDWQAMYNTLKGKYNKEVIPLQNQVRDLNQQVASLQSVITSMESVAAQVSAPADPPAKYVSDEDVAEFGEETVNFVSRVADAKLAGYTSQIGELKQTVAELKGQLQGASQFVQKTERQKVFDFMSENISNWREINKDEGFLQWLQEPDPYSGMQRHALLQRAFENNDAARVLNFFKGFLGEHAVVSEQPPAQQETRQAQVQLETLVAPGRPKEGTVRAQEGKRVWTQAEIKNFYRDVQNKRFAGRDKERARIENDIIAASREGRISA